MGKQTEQQIKCLVWDLDNTLWDGVLLEDDEIALRNGVREVLAELDRRGILLSIASKNDPATALAKLREFGLEEYFLYPQISWNAKSASVLAIREALNIGIDTFAFIDDQPFERDEVSRTHPEVLCLDAAQIGDLLDMAPFQPAFVTEDARNRRQMYRRDLERKQAEAEFAGPAEEFLASLQMVMSIKPAGPEDLQRAEELTVRTHQLNTTGYTYSYEELEALSRSDRHMLLAASLEDKYGAYGKIGLALVECEAEAWRLKLMLMSCRVMSRGVGSVMLSYLQQAAADSGARLQAEFISNERNRMMYVTLKFAGFREVGELERGVLLESDQSRTPAFPTYVRMHTGGQPVGEVRGGAR